MGTFLHGPKVQTPSELSRPAYVKKEPYLRCMRKVPAWQFWLYKWRYLPAAGFMGIQLLQLDDEKCVTGMRLGWRNQNPFRSLYFAAQCAAAEMATGLAAFQIMRDQGARVSMLVTGMDARFYKKATGVVRFECAEVPQVREAIARAHQQSQPIALAVEVHALGADSPEPVASFTLHWSFKLRSKHAQS
jgi:acyl-coenzyme A thioesterase PaaI-like protein